MDRANVAATLMEHLCECDSHGYSQYSRWGEGDYCYVDTEAGTIALKQGDRDCSSAVCDCWQEAIRGTSYQGSLDGATYTGNMRSVFLDSGLFEWWDMSNSAVRGDIYLNESCHTAMCICGDPDNDILGEFSISETGGIDGEEGDQTGWESHIQGYYSYPWDGILHYNGGADGEGNSTQAPQSPFTPIVDTSNAAIGESNEPAYAVRVNGEWYPTLRGTNDATSNDNFAGSFGDPVGYIAIDCPQYRVYTAEGGWLDWVDHMDTNDLVYGAAGDGSAILRVEIPNDEYTYAVHTTKSGWLPTMKGNVDTGGSDDTYAGCDEPIDAICIIK